jgi:hypothetical protein
MRLRPLGQAYSRPLHAMAFLDAERRQSSATFFVRNRAELDLIRLLIHQKPPGSDLTLRQGCRGLFDSLGHPLRTS